MIRRGRDLDLVKPTKSRVAVLFLSHRVLPVIATVEGDVVSVLVLLVKSVVFLR